MQIREGIVPWTSNACKLCRPASFQAIVSRDIVTGPRTLHVELANPVTNVQDAKSASSRSRQSAGRIVKMGIIKLSQSVASHFTILVDEG